jgi:hypothetical protein
MRNTSTTTTTSRLSFKFWVVILMVAPSCRLCRAATTHVQSRSTALAFCSTSTRLTTASTEHRVQPRRTYATTTTATTLGYHDNSHSLQNGFSSREVFSVRNRQGIRLFSSDGDDNSSSSGISSGSATSFSNNRNDWVVPKFVNIPADSLEMSFVRSSGSGGQNVNKVNSQVQVRLLLQEAHWIPYEVRQRLQQREAGRINKEGVLTLHCQEHRTQIQNKKTALHKLQEMILQAWPRPKERNIRTGLSQGTKRRRKEDKRKRGEVKKNRRPVGFD